MARNVFRVLFLEYSVGGEINVGGSGGFAADDRFLKLHCPIHGKMSYCLVCEDVMTRIQP